MVIFSRGSSGRKVVLDQYILLIFTPRPVLALKVVVLNAEFGIQHNHFQSQHRFRSEYLPEILESAANFPYVA
jgi:hypothetical protein